MKNFWDKVDRSGNCWIWQGSVSSQGYGKTGSGKRGISVSAHRAAYEIANGLTVPDGMYVLHRCDNRLCVNPSHLFLGTHLDNMSDKIAKGRTAKGETHGMARLDAARVLAIRSLSKWYMNKELAPIFGVTAANISAIVNRRSWRHI